MLRESVDGDDPETSGVRIQPEILLRALDELNGPEPADEEITAMVARTIARAADVFGVTGVGLMLTDPAEQTLRYVAATDARSARLEAVQEEAGEGPCVEAFVLNRIVATADLRDDARWPSSRKRGTSAASPPYSEFPRGWGRNRSVRSTHTAPTRASGTTARSPA